MGLDGSSGMRPELSLKPATQQPTQHPAGSLGSDRTVGEPEADVPMFDVLFGQVEPVIDHPQLQLCTKGEKTPFTRCAAWDTEEFTVAEILYSCSVSHLSRDKNILPCRDPEQSSDFALLAHFLAL